MAWGRRVRIFWKFFLGRGKLSGRSVLRSEQVVHEWRRCFATWSARGEWAVLFTNKRRCLATWSAREKKFIFNVCYEWRICSVWQVAWERMNGCSYVIERTMQSYPLLREGGLRNDAARAALWRTRPYECAIDVCQLLTMVIAGVCRELSFYL